MILVSIRYGKLSFVPFLNMPLTMNMKICNYAKSANNKYSLCITRKCILIQ
jgi:hypothetical protein